MIKKIVALTLTLAIVTGSLSTVAYAKDDERNISLNEPNEKMVVYEGDLVTEEEAKAAKEAKLKAADAGMDYWDMQEEENGAKTLTFASEKELDTYIKKHELLTTAPDIIEDIEIAEIGYVSRNKERGRWNVMHSQEIAGRKAMLHGLIA